MGRIVDSYTNILTVKLFARPHDEDDYVRDAIERFTEAYNPHAAPFEWHKATITPGRLRSSYADLRK